MNPRHITILLTLLLLTIAATCGKQTSQESSGESFHEIVNEDQHSSDTALAIHSDDTVHREDPPPAFCGNISQAAYNHIIANYRDSSRITYCIDSIPDKLLPDYVKKNLELAYRHWSEVIDIPIYRTTCDCDPHIKVVFEHMDGPGGILGRADFPGFNTPQILTIDKYDVLPGPYQDDYDLFTIALHEAGHTLGVPHLFCPDAVMWPAYTHRVTGLKFQDFVTTKRLYGNTSPFTDHTEREFIWIARDDRSRVHPNFQRNEFFTRCRDFEEDGHFLDTTLIKAVTYIREHYNQPIRISSSYRHDPCNSRVGGSSTSSHLKKKPWTGSLSVPAPTHAMQNTSATYCIEAKFFRHS